MNCLKFCRASCADKKTKQDLRTDGQVKNIIPSATRCIGYEKLISRQDKALDNLPYQHTCNIRQNKWKIIFNILLYCIHDSLLKKIVPSQRSLPTMVFSASLFWIDVCMYINSNRVELYELIKIPRKIISHLGVMALLLNSKNSFGRLPRL